MEKRAKKTACLLTVAVLWAALSAGCSAGSGAEGLTQNALTVQRDGQVKLTIVDSFDKGYYDIEELEKMAREEAESFSARQKAQQTSGSALMSLEEAVVADEDAKIVRVVYRFRDGGAYAAFQGEILYYETLGEAIAAKHIFSGAVLFGAEGAITLDEKNQAHLKGRHVVVTDAKTRVFLPAEVLYYSEGVKLLGDGSADTSGCAETAVLLLKK